MSIERGSENLLRIDGNFPSKVVAKDIIQKFGESKIVIVEARGQMSLNQAVKGIGRVKDNMNVICFPHMMLDYHGELAVRFEVTEGYIDGKTEPDRKDIIRVSAISRHTAIAGAVSGIVREKRVARMEAVGGAAVQQAVRALARADSFLRGDGIYIFSSIKLSDICENGKDKTVVEISVGRRKLPVG